MIDFDKLSKDFEELDENAVLAALRQLAVEGGDAQTAMEACRKGLELVGDRFSTGEYFVGDLIFSGEIMQEAVDILKPLLVQDGGESVGRMVFCTVEGDLHDIGKNIVKALLEAGGMEVLDLGVDVPASRIVDTVKENGLKIVALSGVLTLAVGSMKKTVEALEAAGLRDGVKIIIGGALVTAEICSIVGADAWTQNPQETLSVCRGWAGSL